MVGAARVLGERIGAGGIRKDVDAEALLDCMVGTHVIECSARPRAQVMAVRRYPAPHRG